MTSILQSALRHVAAKIVAQVVRDLETDLAAHDALRRAELLRQAEQHEEWGHEQVGQRLRACAHQADLSFDPSPAPKLSHKETSS